MFRDWNQSIQWQASILGPLIEREMSISALRILDCACGIGTQSLALAERGHTLTGVDLSAAAIARAQTEAQQRRLSIRFTVADMRDLTTLPESNFDVAAGMNRYVVGNERVGPTRKEKGTPSWP